ncbi:MAG: hypothetical protein RDV48_25395 [Candidatus Eremiobacteraeota bacterium]|nr:hypothetical protein [Candidatus Eremiobacteraeota bacterium]
MKERCLFNQRVEMLFARFNEPVIPIESLQKWLGLFEEGDKPAALALLETIEFHSQPRLIRETRLLHAQLQERLAAGGFDEKELTDVDFSREFTCKSGDVVSYIYRKANLIPAVDFKTLDRLAWQTEKHAPDHDNRALVILDDYIGTGSQFIFQFIGKDVEDIEVLNSYKKIYLACYIVHENALEKFRLLRDGKIEEALRREEEQFPDIDFSGEEESLRRALRELDWKNIELVYLEVDRPLLSDSNNRLSAADKRSIQSLLDKFRHEGYSGTSSLMGHHTFFYGAPNSLPEILWPLFRRIEDLSIYTGGTEKLIAVTGKVTRYSIEDIP